MTETGADHRPDGLFIVVFGRTRWSALAEAKIRRSALDPEQVERYLKLDRDNRFDAVITILKRRDPPQVWPAEGRHINARLRA